MNALSALLHQTRRDHYLDGLRREVANMSRSAGDIGGTLLHDAAELGTALSRGGKAVTRTVGRGARAFRRDPVPVLAFAVAAGCLASLIFSRK